MAEPLVAGIDSSTQATKVVVVEPDTGTVVRTARAPHPDGTEIDPEHWWRALQQAVGDGLLDGVRALGVGGQQHGMVALDDAGAVVRPALLWNDTRSAAAAGALVAELGGPRAWVDAVGSVPLAAFTVAKLRWLAEHEPDAAERTAAVALPHDWVSARLLGGALAPDRLSTDRGDASGTGYWSSSTGYRHDLVTRALGHDVVLPAVLGPAEPYGETPDGVVVSAGTGDNMAAALGLGIDEGDVVVSLGTSGTAFAVHDTVPHDPSGSVAGFADATGRFLPLVCTLNAARVLGAGATLLGTDLAGLEKLALSARPGAGGLVLLPYLDGERTPDLPDATGTLGGLTRVNATPENLARACVEGMLCGMADGVDALVAQGVTPRRMLLIGGAAQSRAVQQVAADLFGVPVSVPTPAEYVALGAARQAAWALTGALPEWPRTSETVVDPVHADAGQQVRADYRALRLSRHPET